MFVKPAVAIVSLLFGHQDALPAWVCQIVSQVAHSSSLEFLFLIISWSQHSCTTQLSYTQETHPEVYLRKSIILSCWKCLKGKIQPTCLDTWRWCDNKLTSYITCTRNADENVSTQLSIVAWRWCTRLDSFSWAPCFVFISTIITHPPNKKAWLSWDAQRAKFIITYFAQALSFTTLLHPCYKRHVQWTFAESNFCGLYCFLLPHPGAIHQQSWIVCQWHYINLLIHSVNNFGLCPTRVTMLCLLTKPHAAAKEALRIRIGNIPHCMYVNMYSRKLKQHRTAWRLRWSVKSYCEPSANVSTRWAQTSAYKSKITHIWLHRLALFWTNQRGRSAVVFLSRSCFFKYCNINGWQ